MSYQVYNPCNTAVVNPVCSPCLDDIELGRVRGVAYIHESYYPTLKADPENRQKWIDGISQGHIKIIPKTSGSFDGGSPVEVSGYGDTETAIIGYKYQLTYKDPTLKGNTPFYNSIKKSSSYHIAFRTQTLTRISDNPVTVIPKTPVEEDMTSQVVFNVDVKFNGEDVLVPFVTPTGVFDCK